MTQHCDSCAWFLHRAYCRDDLKREMENAEIDGHCVEESNCLFFIPHIVNAPFAHCGKWTERDYHPSNPH